MKIYSWLNIPIFLTISCLVTTPAIADPFGRPEFFERGRREFEREIQRFEQSNTVTTPSLTTPSQTTDNDKATLTWSRFVVNQGGFTIEAPNGVITDEVETVEFPTGDINFDIVATHPPSSRYLVAYSEVLTPEKVANSQEVLERARDYIIENEVNLVKVSDRDIKFKKYPGKEFKLQNKDETITFRLLVTKDRIYVLAVSQNSDAISQKSVNTFFKSFKLIN
ncbi:MAG: hypothetical protein AB4372_05860 [Xenococcus sp. (in: cyanobacteria)]